MSDDLIERLEAHVTDICNWNGRAMTNWDQWQQMILDGDRGSEPRDCYESSIGAYAEDMQEAAAALRAAAQREAKLREALEKIANGSRDADATYAALLAEVRREARAALNPSRPSQPNK